MVRCLLESEAFGLVLVVGQTEVGSKNFVAHIVEDLDVEILEGLGNVERDCSCVGPHKFGFIKVEVVAAGNEA